MLSTFQGDYIPEERYALFANLPQYSKPDTYATKLLPDVVMD